MEVYVRGFATLAADELVYRQAALAALDVPERITPPADGAVEDGVVLVVGAHVAQLPDMLDPVGRAPYDEGLQVFGHRSRHPCRAATRERGGGAPVTVEAGLIGGDFHDRGVVDAVAADLYHTHI